MPTREDIEQRIALLVAEGMDADAARAHIEDLAREEGDVVIVAEDGTEMEKPLGPLM